MLKFDRKQQNSVKQLSFNNNKKRQPIMEGMLVYTTQS